MKFILVLLLITLSNSCSDSNEIKSVNIKGLNDSIKLSSRLLKNENDSLYRILESKLKDNSTAEISLPWVAKAQNLQYRSDQIYKDIEAFVSKSDSAFYNTDSLYEKLNNYRYMILRIDPNIAKEFTSKSEILTHNLDSLKQSSMENLHKYFSSRPKQEQQLILNQALNNVKTVENEILTFCNNQIKQ